MSIRRLSTQDIFIYRELRLMALQESPTAFGSSLEEESAYQTDDFAARLRNPKSPDAVVFGAFGEGDPAPLLGMLGFGREDRLKRVHSGFLWGMYVQPQNRGRGIAAALLDAALAYARTVAGLRQVTLGVTSTNLPAVMLYQSRGFVPYGLEPDYLCIKGAYHDMEHMVLKL